MDTTEVIIVLQVINIAIVGTLVSWFVLVLREKLKVKDERIQFLKEQLEWYDPRAMRDRMEANKKLIEDEKKQSDRKHSKALETAQSQITQLEDKLRTATRQYEGALRAIIDDHNTLILDSGSTTAQPIDSKVTVIHTSPFIG